MIIETAVWEKTVWNKSKDPVIFIASKVAFEK